MREEMLNQPETEIVNDEEETENRSSEEKSEKKKRERGSAIVISLLVMALLMVFVAVSMSRSTSETLVMANDASEGRAYAAAHASLEVTTRNFNKIFDIKTSPETVDLTRISTQFPPGMETDFRFLTDVTQIEANRQTQIDGGLLQGLYATRSRWRVDTTATERTTGVEVQLRREFFNNLVPLFQFGIFYNDDLEFHPGPRFDFGGRVHSNGSIYMMAGTGLYFSSRVSAKNQILTQKGRNGDDASRWGENVFIRNAAGTYKQLKKDMGSALHNTTNGANVCTNTFPDDSPPCYRNAAWTPTIEPIFNGNLLADQKSLDLPLRNPNGDYIEMIKRGRAVGDLHNNPATGNVEAVVAANADSNITARERFANKVGIRISLADNKTRLPGCASAGLLPCGLRLDGDAGLTALLGTSITADQGYNPMTFPMTDNYVATRLNGNRLRSSGRAGAAAWENNNAMWIKVELVSTDGTNTITQDVTADFLALGVTEAAPRIEGGGTTKFEIQNNYHTATTQFQDSRSVIQLQRFLMSGVRIRSAAADNSNQLDWYDWSGDGNGTHNIAVTNNIRNNDAANGMPGVGNVFVNNCSGSNGIPTIGVSATTNGNFRDAIANTGFTDDNAHKRAAIVRTDGTARTTCIVPFPIKMFDTREGLHDDSMNTGTTYPNGAVPLNGVMSLVQINVGNLRRFLNGEFNNSMPTTTPYAVARGGQRLQSTDVPRANGWVLYISDRRGDRDFDGEYDMEDIYGAAPGNNNTLEPGEDINRNGVLERDLFDAGTNPAGEAVSFAMTSAPDAAAVIEHRFYRRGVRLVNGTQLPGVYDPVTPTNTLGFTVASENGVYVQGNYNATGITAPGSPTPATGYLPQNSPAHIPAAVVGDGVMILSNNWSDTRSFRFPFALGSRPASETTIRFAMISGDALSSFSGAPNQGGGDLRLTGGVHNFKRFLESWGARLNYTGSLINLYNSRNNSGAFKCCTNVYSPPTRNWTFDTSFLDPTRLPPGTPFIQYIQLTGFERVND